MPRWLEVTGENNLTIVNRAGRLHGNANAMSMRPCNNCKHFESEEIKNSEMKYVVPIRFMANPEGDQIQELPGWVEWWSPKKL